MTTATDIATDISAPASQGSNAPADTYTRWTDEDSYALEEALSHPALAECPLTEMFEGFVTGTAVSPFDGMAEEMLRLWLDLFGLEWDKLGAEVTGPLEAIVQKRLDAIMDSFDEALTAARAGGGAAGLEPLMTDWDVVFAKPEADANTEATADTVTNTVTDTVTDSDDGTTAVATPGRKPQPGELWARGLLLAEMAWRDHQWARLDKNARKEVEKRHQPIRILAKPLASGDARQRARLIDEAISNLHTMHQITDEYYELLNLTPAPIIKVSTPGRNDPCECGSGKKYKKCCGV